MNVRLSVLLSAAVLSSLALVSSAHAQAPAGSAHQHGGGAGGGQHGGAAPATNGSPAGAGHTNAAPANNAPAANNTMAAHGNAPAGNAAPAPNNNMNHPGPGGQPGGQPGPGGGVGFGVNVNVNANVGAQRPVVRGAPVVYDARIQHENDAWLAQRDAARRNAAMWDAQRAQREDAHRRELEARWGQDFYYRPECRYEIALDADRTARLTRIIDIAEDNHDPALAARARNLLARENARHAREMIGLRIRLGYQ